MGYAIGLMGIFYIQDGLASIAFYPKERWKYNHTARLIRIVFGMVLVVLGALLL